MQSILRLQQPTYLLQIGQGRPGRWSGFQQFGLSKLNFERVQTLADEFDDDDICDMMERLTDDNAESTERATLSLLLACNVQIDGCFEDNQQLQRQIGEWAPVPEPRAPYAGVHTICIWDSYT